MADQTTTRCGSCRDWIKSPPCLIYTNFALSSWGDRLWNFAVGLYLVYLDGGSLRLAAIYGFSAGLAIILLGGLIGHWVDTNGRMKVVRLSLFLQNSLVMLSALSVYFILDHHGKLGYSLRIFSEAIIMILALTARLASVAYKVAIEKDWIVVVAAGNKALLANLNAVTRAIDLMSKVIAPTVAGQIMTYGSLKMAAMFIAGWNVVSVFVEYALLHKVYQLVPRLAVKESVQADGEKEEEMKDMSLKNIPDANDDHSLIANRPDSAHQTEQCVDGAISPDILREDVTDGKEEEAGLQGKKNGTLTQVAGQKTTTQLIFGPFLRLFSGWGLYIRQRIVFAGLALALLYMTVLGFDSITVGYIYYQGISESILGICTAIAGVTGIVGTFLFTRLRKKRGLEQTGLIAFSAEITCLLFCVASVWAPGSPFNLNYKEHSPMSSNCSISQTLSANESIALQTSVPYMVGSESEKNFSSPERVIREVSMGFHSYKIFSGKEVNSHHDVLEQNLIPHDASLYVLKRIKRNQLSNVTQAEAEGDKNANELNNAPAVADLDIVDNSTTNALCESTGDAMSKISISLFLVGILTSRVGLWMADLVVTQLLQENVAEKHRGVVGGVQHSLNMLIDTLKFTMVIIAPRIETFGILILLSFLFVCLGGCSFGVHTWRTSKAEKQQQDGGGTNAPETA